MTRFTIHSVYAAPIISVIAAPKAYQKFTLIAPRITMNSPTKPDVAGRPELAIANNTAKNANLGIVFTTPPYAEISRECTRSYSTPMHKNIAAEMKPCDTICTRPPSIPCELKMKNPSVTNPMCEMEEYATSFFMSVCASATRPM